MNELPVLDPVLLDLLVEWEESKESGAVISLEKLCARCPDRMNELRFHIERISHIDSLLALVDAKSPPSLPGFEQLEEIGRGGMGVVYKARDIQLDQVVAIKVPFGSRNGLSSRKRFERETKTLAKLRHKNIVQVRSAGFADDSPYLVMDYVPGGSLSERMRELAKTPRQVAALMSQVSRAVSHAHSAGIVHRDLKPGNILLSAEGEPLVSDFGVAAVLLGEPVNSHPSADTPADRQSDQSTRLTHSAAVGTPAYLPPEASSGAPGNVSASTDVWSLGVILYECLTGRLPYPELESGNRDYKSPPPRPSSLRRDIPRGLERITERCLTIDPARRYPTAQAIAAELDRWMARVESSRKLKRIGLYGAACVALLLSLLVGFLVWQPTAVARHEKRSSVLVAALPVLRTIELTGPSGPPKTCFIRVNQELASTGISKEGYFFAECTRPCLVELLHNVPGDRYLFTADLRQITGRGVCEIGLYCGHSFVTSAPNPGHRFIFLSFADLGQPSSTLKAGPNGEPLTALRLQGLRYLPPDTTGTWQSWHFDTKWYPTHVTKPGPWRRVSLEVSADALKGQCDNVQIPSTNARAIDPSIASPLFPRGGIGVYVNNCRVEIKNCHLTLLSNP